MRTFAIFECLSNGQLPIDRFFLLISARDWLAKSYRTSAIGFAGELSFSVDERIFLLFANAKFQIACINESEDREV